MIRTAILSFAATVALSSAALAQGCVGEPVSVQVLGSGGPGHNATRASASYLLWVGGQAKMLVDIGGGTNYRFAQSGAKFPDLSLIAISHLPPDHPSDLPALFWSGRQSRSDTLPIAGPSGNDIAPDFSVFLNRLFDAKTGAFQVLSPVMTGMQGNQPVVRLDPKVVDVKKPEATTVLDEGGMTVTAFGIPHGPLPTLAYRVQTRGLSVVFSSDQTGANPKFVDFARGANVLIMHFATNMEGSPLHASPAVVGRVARDAGVGRLILSHIGQFPLDPALAELKTAYAGPLTVGADLQCTPVR